MGHCTALRNISENTGNTDTHWEMTVTLYSGVMGDKNQLNESHKKNAGVR